LKPGRLIGILIVLEEEDVLGKLWFLLLESISSDEKTNWVEEEGMRGRGRCKKALLVIF
jgi:hypothetical protein